jgi:hypothetical protein
LQSEFLEGDCIIGAVSEYVVVAMQCCESSALVREADSRVDSFRTSRDPKSKPGRPRGRVGDFLPISRSDTLHLHIENSRIVWDVLLALTAYGSRAGSRIPR